MPEGHTQVFATEHRSEEVSYDPPVGHVGVASHLPVDELYVWPIGHE